MKRVEIETTTLKPWDVRPEDFEGKAKLNLLNVRMNEKGQVELDAHYGPARFKDHR